MNEAVTRLLAARLGLSEEQIAALQHGDPSALMAAGRVDDPVLAAALASALQQPTDAPVISTLTPDQQEIERLRRMLSAAKHRIRELKQDLEAADAMVRYLALVFGACPACWGQNRLCARCHGAGRPGSAQPVEEALLDWVRPALRKLGLRVATIER
jgi:hypothetical protein